MQIANDRWSGIATGNEVGSAGEQAVLNRMCSLYYESSLCEDGAEDVPVNGLDCSRSASSEPEEDTYYE